MSADKRRGRGLSADERALWRGATRSVAPLAPHRPQPVTSRPPDDAGTKKSEPPATLLKPRAPSAPARLAHAPDAAPPLAPLDRRLRKRVARGNAPIEARIDLHGLTQSEAHRALLGFLRRAQADGARIALVVTGKGGAGAREGGGERGVLRRQVPHWLRLPEFRTFVVGFESAGAGHGGEGALYVRLRRLRTD
jgi:DNA-nicking Smr family endonuclease